MALTEAKKHELIAGLAKQSAALVAKAGLPAGEVAQTYLQLACAVAIQAGASPLECALALREMAGQLEALDAAQSGPPGPLVA